jgi:hypothetical protein
MKKSLLSASIFVLAVLSFQSCKSNSTSSSNDIPSQTMQATINGVQ